MLRARAALAAAAISLLGTHVAEGQQQPPQASFRSRITIVPLDVRVLDRSGKPVTDLKQEDFTIVEDDAPQTIRYFSTQSLSTETPEPGGQPDFRKAATAEDLTPQNRRVFLILLGRGRMMGPSKELPALLEFLQKRLLPQDQVALFAFNRGTDFTTNHEAVRTVVERYRDRHERIETLLEEYFYDLRAEYGSKDIPAFIQTEINGIFAGATGLRPRSIAPGQGSDARQIDEDVRRTADDLRRAEILKGRTGEFAGLPDPGATSTAERLDVSFEEYIARQVELNHDLSNLYAGIDYLRYLEGEKHLVFVTPKGIALPRLDNNKTLAAAASDGRVALDIIYIGGAVGAPRPRFVGPGNQIVMSPLPSPAAVFGQSFTMSDMRLMSDMTGGQMTAFQSADRAFTRLDQSTRFQYLLGYSPSNSTTNGAFRRIVVKVKRPGTTVLYRQGYYATPQVVPMDRRQFITFNRLTAAGRYEGVIQDIEVTVNPPTPRGEGAARELLVEGRIHSSRIKFVQADGAYMASLDIGVYAGDGKEQVVGEVLRKVDLKLKEDAYRTFMKQGATFDVRLPLKGDPKYVKVVVYDYAADLLGTAVTRLK